MLTKPLSVRAETLASALFGMLLCLVAGCAMAAPLGTELIVNGDAERGTTAGWRAYGMEAVDSADAGSLGLPPDESIGNWSFTSRLGSFLNQIMIQQVDVSVHANLIDSNRASAEFSVLIQSRDSTVGRSFLRCLDSNGAPIVVMGLFEDSHDLPGLHDWESFSTSFVTPAGTRSLDIWLVTTLADEGHAYFDNVSVVLSSVPEAGTAASMLAGLAAVGWMRRRRAHARRAGSN